MNVDEAARRGRSASVLRTLAGSLLRGLGWRAGPLEYESAAADADLGGSPGPVDVIVPVHGAADAVERCLESLWRHTDLRRHRLVIVADADPGFPAAELRARAGREEADAVVLENPRRRGFAGSVNRGMAHSRRDVLLLNSDTLVTRRWLEKLQEAAYSAPDIATVTPFSNHATICSLPQPLEHNALPTGYDADAFARLVEQVAVRRYPRLPTGVGMCLYVKRGALDRLGLFDERRFRAGYGEETDFCFRALAAGFRHALDDATFIFHEGERSFGGRKAARIRAAERLLRRRHPAYVATLDRFLRRDPLAACRRRVVAALTPPRPAAAAKGQALEPARVLHVVHGWPPESHGGTELYAYWLAQRQKSRRPVAVYARIADRGRRLGDVTEVFDAGLRLRLVVNNFLQRLPWSRNALRDPLLEADFERFLEQFEPNLVHVHHLAGHALSLLQVAAVRGVPIVYQVQDWWVPCARANLLRPDRSLCSGPAPGKCSACLPLTGLPPAFLWNRVLYRYRTRLARRGLRLADAWVMGSRAIERDYRRLGMLDAAGDRVHVLPYGVELPPAAAAPRAFRAPLRCGYVGTLMPHKGAHVAVEAFTGLEPSQARLEIWGDPSAAPDYARELERRADPRTVRFRGAFAESERGDVFARLDLLVVPSLGLESFGLVAREAMARGVPVVASRRGALEELFGEAGGGALFEPGDAAGLRRLIAGLAERPQTLAEWARAMPRVVGLEEHAAAIERVYGGVLARRAREA